MGSAPTAKQLRAGNGSGKTSAYTALTAAKSLMSARRTGCLHDVRIGEGPRPSSSAPTLASDWRAWASTPSASVPVSGFRPSWPDR